jgi:inositol-phosphate phosphatase/L-galactose 1-phosphate phosphatase/histidinol-phosphatase
LPHHTLAAHKCFSTAHPWRAKQKTKTGKPLWGTLVALLHRGTPVLGIIDQPITRERWVGVAGRQTTLNGAVVRVRPCPGGLGEAYLYATTPAMFGAPGSPTAAAWGRVSAAAKAPLYGCDCYAYGLVSAGWADVVVEADLGPYDYLALAPVVTGAGGVMTDWAGRPLGAAWDAGAGHSLAACPRAVVAAGDAAVHAEALAALAWEARDEVAVDEAEAGGGAGGRRSAR